jgi:hypothetical protein
VTGCGSTTGRSTPTATVTGWSQHECAYQAAALADSAHQILLHYGSQSSYPADVGYFSFRNGFAAFRSHGCPAEMVSRSLTRRLTPRQRTELLSHLPTALARSVRRVLAAGY